MNAIIWHHMRTKTVEEKIIANKFVKTGNPEKLEKRGSWGFVEIKVNGVWRGVMLLGREGEIVRFRYGGEWVDHGCFPSKNEIEEMREAGLVSRLRAEIPLIFFWIFPYFCLVAIPILIFLQGWIGVWDGGMATGLGLVGIIALLGKPNEGAGFNFPLFALVCGSTVWAISAFYSCLSGF